MSAASIKFHPSETIVNERFTGLTGGVNPANRGLILENKDGEDRIVSISFGDTPEIIPNDEAWLGGLGTGMFTNCFEGPLIKLWWDLGGEYHISTTNKLDCKKSYWGNKEERFGDLFENYGGLKFLENYKGSQDLTHHFMILTRDLSVTNDINLNSNKCVIVYLGSMNRVDYTFEMIDFSDDLFVAQKEINYIPDNMNNCVLYPIVSNTDENNSKEKMNDILHYGYLTNNEWNKVFAPLSVSEKNRGIDTMMISSYFGEPVIYRSPFNISKFVPKGYYKKCEIIGNSPNIKLLVFKLMTDCRPKHDTTLEYFEKYDFLFVPELSFLKVLKDVENPKVSIIENYRDLGTMGYVDARNFKTTRCRERNLMLVLLLCLPKSKSKVAIEAYEEFLETQEKLIKFISINNRRIIEGKYDEIVKNERVLSRLKDIASRAKQYSEKHSDDINKSFSFSIKGLVHNERGDSLYRIMKDLKTID